MFLRAVAILLLVLISPGFSDNWSPQPAGPHKYAIVDIDAIWKAYPKYQRRLDEIRRPYQDRERKQSHLRDEIADLQKQLATSELADDVAKRLSQALHAKQEYWNTVVCNGQYVRGHSLSSELVLYRKCGQEILDSARIIAEERGILFVIHSDNGWHPSDAQSESVHQSRNKSAIFCQIDITADVLDRLNKDDTAAGH